MTDLAISSNLGGTIAFYFSYSSNVGAKIAEFFVGASATISPAIGAIESTIVDGVIWANVSASGTDGWKVTASGFELPTV